MSELLLKEEGRGNVLAVQDTVCPQKMPDWILGYYSTLSCIIQGLQGPCRRVCVGESFQETIQGKFLVVYLYIIKLALNWHQFGKNSLK